MKLYIFCAMGEFDEAMIKHCRKHKIRVVRYTTRDDQPQYQIMSLREFDRLLLPQDQTLYPWFLGVEGEPWQILQLQIVARDIFNSFQRPKAGFKVVVEETNEKIQTHRGKRRSGPRQAAQASAA